MEKVCTIYLCETVFAAFYTKCPYNISTGFERNYFSATNCCCYAENYTFFCLYYFSFNYKVKKACILVDDIKRFLLTFTLLICICNKRILKFHFYIILIAYKMKQF